MAQDRWINITVDPNAATRTDRQGDSHGKALGGAAAGDLTLSFDMAKFTSHSLLRSAVKAALDQAAGMMKP